VSTASGRPMQAAGLLRVAQGPFAMVVAGRNAQPAAHHDVGVGAIRETGCVAAIPSTRLFSVSLTVSPLWTRQRDAAETTIPSLDQVGAFRILHGVERSLGRRFAPVEEKGERGIGLLRFKLPDGQRNCRQNTGLEFL